MTLNDKDREVHYNRIEENYRETPVNQRFFKTPNVEQEDFDRSRAKRDTDVEKVRHELSERAVEIGKEVSQKGGHQEYKKCLEQAKQEAVDNKESK